MKLALYLPNFRDKVTIKELEDLTRLAEELDFDSVWTLDRVVVPADAAVPPPVDELDRACLDRIARFKRPRDYHFVDALPTNNYGKVLKRELQARLGGDPARPA